MSRMTRITRLCAKDISMDALRQSNGQLKKNLTALHGCSQAEAIRINGAQPLRTVGSPSVAYLNQRAAAGKRGVSWEITFPEWWQVWQLSGMYAQRGRGLGAYCMSRKNDIGPYKVGNVFIQLSTTNSREGFEIARLTLEANRHMGYGRGWTLRATNKNPYQVIACSKYVGMFPTQEAAEAAYNNAILSHKASMLPEAERRTL